MSPRPRVPASLSLRVSASCGIFLDLTGCDRLFGGLPNLVRQIHHALSRLRIAARLAVAPTPGAAWALAEAGKNGAIVSPEELNAALAPLPPAALRLSDGLSAALHHLGLSTIGQVAPLPRDVLPARFGKELLHRLDQALGKIAEPLVPLEHHSPVEAHMEFDGPVSSLEAIHSVARRLLQLVIEQLTHRGCGARRLDMELCRPYAPPMIRSISLSHPSRDFRSLYNLMECGLEAEGQRDEGTKGQRVDKANRTRISSPFVPSSLCPFVPSTGYIAFHLRVPLLQRLSEEQIFLLEQEHHANRLEVDRLIDRLRLRLGEASAVRVELVESHLPEKAWRIGRWGVESGAWGVRSREISSASVLPTPYSPLPTRPLHLLAHPTEIRVIVSPSDAIDGRPAAFVLEHQVHQVTYWRGPERIAGCWWDGRNKTRDYFEVEIPQGRRFWIFRVMETGKWYLHGQFS